MNLLIFGFEILYIHVYIYIIPFVNSYPQSQLHRLEPLSRRLRSSVVNWEPSRRSFGAMWCGDLRTGRHGCFLWNVLNFKELFTLPETNRSCRAQVPVTKKHMRLQIPMELRVWLHRGLFFQTPKLVLFVIYTCQAQAIPSLARNSCGEAGLDMCKVCTEAVHSVALWTRVTLQVWTCVKYVPKQSIPSTLNTGYITALDMCIVCTEAVHSVALWTRVTLGLDMCKVCTEAVHSVALWTRVRLQVWTCVKYVPKQSIP